MSSFSISRESNEACAASELRRTEVRMVILYFLLLFDSSIGMPINATSFSSQYGARSCMQALVE